MKQIIVLCAVFILLSSLILQIPVEMMNYERRHAIMFYVNNAKEMAKQEGYYTDEILNKLKRDIATKMKIKNPEEIIIGNETTRTIKYRPECFDEREIICLKVSVPFSDIIAAPLFWGFDPTVKRYYTVEEKATSERLWSVK